MVMANHKNEPWLGMPAKQIYLQGKPVFDGRGKAIYKPSLEWISNEARVSFTRTVIELLLDAYPGALNDTAGER